MENSEAYPGGQFEVYQPRQFEPEAEISQSTVEAHERNHGFTRLRRLGLAIAGLGLAFNTMTPAEARNDHAPAVVADIPYYGGNTHLECGPVTTSHRGMAGNGENTIPGINRGLRTGADAVEIDVRLTKDKKLINIHDPKWNRTTRAIGFVKNTLYEKVRKIRTNNGSHVPLLKRSLWTIANFGSNDRRVQLDLKVDLTDVLANQILGWIDRYNLRERVTFASSKLGRLAKFNRLAPDIPGGYIQPNGRWPNLANVPGYVDTINVESQVGTRRRIRRAAGRGFGVLVRSVNSTQAALRAIRNKAAAINSDDPDDVVRACD